MAKNKKIGFAAVFIGLLFFFNPNVGMFDVFPDFIGAILIYFGLAKAAVADGYFEDARKISFYLIWIYLLKAVLSLMFIGNASDAVPYVFLTAVVEIIFTVSFFRKLYTAFEYTALRTEDAGDISEKAAGESTFAALFIAARGALSFIPEILELIKQNNDIDLSASAAYRMPIIQLKPYVMLLCVFAGLILGVIYLARTSSFFRRAAGNRSYCEGLYEKYLTEKTENAAKYRNRTLSASYAFLTFAAVFMVDFYIGRYDILPDILGAAVMFASFLCLAGISKDRKIPKITVILSFVITALDVLVCIFVRPVTSGVLASDASAKSLAAYGFLSGGWAFAASIALQIAYIAVFGVLIVKWSGLAKSAYKGALMGVHDRKLLAVIIGFFASLVLKAVSYVSEIYLATLACREDIAEYLSKRSRMTSVLQYEASLENPTIAMYENLDGFAYFMRIAAAVLVVFTVFAIFSLSSETTGKEDF